MCNTVSNCNVTASWGWEGPKGPHAVLVWSNLQNMPDKHLSIDQWGKLGRYHIGYAESKMVLDLSTWIYIESEGARVEDDDEVAWEGEGLDTESGCWASDGDQTLLVSWGYGEDINWGWDGPAWAPSPAAWWGLLGDHMLVVSSCFWAFAHTSLQSWHSQ